MKASSTSRSILRGAALLALVAGAILLLPSCQGKATAPKKLYIFNWTYYTPDSVIEKFEKEGGDGYFVEMGPGKQWAQVDLGASYALHAILAWHYHSQARVYRDVIVQVSDRKDFLKGAQTIFNNDHDNSAGLGVGKDKEYIEVAEGRLFDPKGIKGRYVRMYSGGNTTNDLNHYVEVGFAGGETTDIFTRGLKGLGLGIDGERRRGRDVTGPNR